MQIIKLFLEPAVKLSASIAYDHSNGHELDILTKGAEYILNTMKKYFMELNDAVTRRQIYTDLNEHFLLLKKFQTIYDYKIIVDETNNVPTTIDLNEFVVDAYFKFTKSLKMPSFIHCLMEPYPIKVV